LQKDIKIKKSFLVTPYKIAMEGLDIFISSHPMPSARSEEAAEEMMDIVSSLKESDFFLYLLSGGSSVGRRDFTLQVLERLENTELLAHGVAIRPGKPTILACQGNKAVFGLPGHVASAMVVFYLLVLPLLRRLAGMTGDLGLLPVRVITGEQIPSAIGREEYIRVQLHRENNNQPWVALPVYGKSGLLTPLVNADGLLVIERDSEGLDKGAPARVLLFPSFH
jgi:molybdopterin molybdotransferase